MQKPTSEAIKEQVSVEVAEQLPDQVSELDVETFKRLLSKEKETVWLKLSHLNKKPKTPK